MLGAMIGDIAGSRFEFHNHRSKEFEIFHKRCSFTDDTVMSLAIAQAIMDYAKILGSGDIDIRKSTLMELAIKSMQNLGRQYPYCGYGGRFERWIFSDNPRPYNSFGNGAAMRVSPVAWFNKADTLEKLKFLSLQVTGLTHNHTEGIKGAEATALAIWMARRGSSKQAIREVIERDYYRLDFTIDAIRPTYEFNETCQNTVPQALECFFESESFEDLVRLAISVGGDSDTLAAIACSVGEAFYGVPDDMKKRALGYLDETLLAVYKRWEDFLRSQAQANANA